VSVWIAIDEAEKENACVEVIPGSHKLRVPHVASTATGRFGIQADARFLDESAKVSIELKPGEFFIFDRWLLHGSAANRSTRRRLGLSARIIPPRVRVDLEKMQPYFPELGVQLIRGEDTLGLNRIVPAPSDQSAVRRQ
jgi:ectoine hydroxylase-related dioxygenase (phytanoyl-CoA dioxygenase family)